MIGSSRCMQFNVVDSHCELAEWNDRIWHWIGVDLVRGVGGKNLMSKWINFFFYRYYSLNSTNRIMCINFAKSILSMICLHQFVQCSQYSENSHYRWPFYIIRIHLTQSQAITSAHWTHFSIMWNVKKIDLHLTSSLKWAHAHFSPWAPENEGKKYENESNYLECCKKESEWYETTYFVYQWRNSTYLKTQSHCQSKHIFLLFLHC